MRAENTAPAAKGEWGVRGGYAIIYVPKTFLGGFRTQMGSCSFVASFALLLAARRASQLHARTTWMNQLNHQTGNPNPNPNPTGTQTGSARCHDRTPYAWPSGTQIGASHPPRMQAHS